MSKGECEYYITHAFFLCINKFAISPKNKYLKLFKHRLILYTVHLIGIKSGKSDSTSETFTSWAYEKGKTRL